MWDSQDPHTTDNAKLVTEVENFLPEVERIRQGNRIQFALTVACCLASLRGSASSTGQ